VRRPFLILGMIMVVQMLHAQEKNPWRVDRICGRAEYLKRIPERKRPNNYSDKRRSLSGVSLELYEAADNSPCCSEVKNVGSTTSGRGGQFEFNPDRPGRYWLMAKWNGKDYKVAIDFEPKKKSTTVCSEQGIQIEDDGDASWWVTVTVD
jgi:hypothetical protein